MSPKRERSRSFTTGRTARPGVAVSAARAFYQKHPYYLRLMLLKKSIHYPPISEDRCGLLFSAMNSIFYVSYLNTLKCSFSSSFHSIHLFLRKVRTNFTYFRYFDREMNLCHLSIRNSLMCIYLNIMYIFLGGFYNEYTDRAFHSLSHISSNGGF
jgi:hypothetical protein